MIQRVFAEVMLNLLAFVVLWSSLGLLACVVFRRSGHNFLLFAGLAVWMGPFILVVMRFVSREQAPAQVNLLRIGEPLDGWLDILVGVDGSVESSTSATAALDTIRPAIRRIRFAAVLDHETAANPDFFTADEEIERMLFATTNRLDLPNAEIALLSGRADRALMSHATEEGFDLLLVSHRNHRGLAALLGSTVQRLSHHAPIPVLVGPPPSDTAETDPAALSASTGER